MNKKTLKIILFLGIVLALFLWQPQSLGFVSALEIDYPDLNIFGQNFSINDTSTLPDYVCYFYGLITDLAFLIAVMVIAFGGVYYLISYGRGKFTSEAKDWIKSGILGLLIVVSISLIAYTLNPDLNTCRLGILSMLNFNTSDNVTAPPGVSVATYKEIPIGVLTENLLTRTMDCYAFDKNGDPIDGSEVNGGVSPTYLNHDKADCLMRLVEGAQKKTEAIATLSGEITRLMNTCSCRVQDANGNDTGASKCDPDYQCGEPTACPNGSCNSQAVGGACHQPPNTTDCCPAGVKDKIEHGPISVSANLAGDPATNSNKFVYSNLQNYTTANLADAQLTNKKPLNVFLLTTSCLTDSNCPYDQPRCYGGQCINYSCSTDTNCPTGQRCVGGQCIIINCSSNYNCGAGSYTGSPFCQNGNVYQNYNGYVCNNPGTSNSYCSNSSGPQLKVTCPSNRVCTNGVCTSTSSGIGDCITDPVEYNGLDEFRCPNPIQGGHSSCDDIQSFVESQRTITGRIVTVIDQDRWDELNLLQQLMYFKEKINAWTEDSKIQEDKNILSQAKAMLNSKSCYLATSYADLVKTYESTNQQNQIILTQKVFTDPGTNQPVNASKYCNGFNYANSSCLKKCNDMCPDTGGNYGICASQSDPEACIENAYNSRPCPYGDTGSQNFGACVSSCQNDCKDVCAEQYQECSSEYNFCKSQCTDNGQCVLDNADKCLFGAEAFVNCANTPSDQGNKNFCINNAYLCKNGSNEYAGYLDCAEPSSVKCTTFTDQESCESKTQCLWSGQVCSQNYSASFFYQNPTYQKCSSPYAIPTSGYCRGSTARPNTTCETLCPETSKCPASSKCPECPCDQINDQTMVFSVPNESISDRSNANYNAGNEGFTTSEQKISAYRMVGPQCNGYSYNDDPLTFYCEVDPWHNQNSEVNNKPTEPIGSKMTCPPAGEIPVGQTVDNAENWANWLMTVPGEMEQDIQTIIDQTIKIGEAINTDPIQDYCKCNAKLENNDPICKTDCIYEQHLVCGENSCTWVCSCIFVPCAGSPCEQVVDYLSELWNAYKQLKLDFIDFYTAMLKEPRSDIMKELTYSRQETNSCGQKSSAYGADLRMLSCTRVKDEQIPPVSMGQIIINDRIVKYYCYGKELGRVTNDSLLDNWFCCQKQNKQDKSSGY